MLQNVAVARTCWQQIDWLIVFYGVLVLEVVLD